MGKLKEKYVVHQWETVSCPFCNSNENKIIEKYGCDLQFTNVKCNNCGVVYQSPRPKYDDIFLQAAYGEYMNFEENYKISDLNLHRWKIEMLEILKFDKTRSKILDVGCAMGDFLFVAKDYFNECIGVEVGENMAEFTRKKLGIKVYNGEYTQLNFDEKFSCVHLSHVIEHIPNPKEWLQKSKSLLDKDGVLVINVPNKYSLVGKLKLLLVFLKLRTSKWKDNTRTPDHLFEPTVKSMFNFIESNGFKVIKHYTYSRKDMDSSTLRGLFYNRFLKAGSNIRYFAISND